MLPLPLNLALDPCGLIVVAAIFFVIGRKLIEGRDRLRQLGRVIAGLSFIGFFALGGLASGSSEQLLAAGLSSLGGAGVVLGVAWIVFGLVNLVHEHTTAPLLSGIRAWSRARQQAANEKLRRLEEARQRRLAQEEYDRQAPERERRRRQQEQEARLKAEAARRREIELSSCEELYLKHAPEIRHRFPRGKFDAFIQRHLADCHDPESVAERARQLKAIILEHRQKAEIEAREAREEAAERKRQEDEERRHQLEIERLAREADREPTRPEETPASRMEQIRKTVELMHKSGMTDEQILAKFARDRAESNGFDIEDTIDENDLYYDVSGVNHDRKSNSKGTARTGPAASDSHGRHDPRRQDSHRAQEPFPPGT